MDDALKKFEGGMKPMMIVPPNVMSKEDVALLRENGICVVEATDPARVKFVDPIPAVSNRTQIEKAAIDLSRKVLNRQWGHITTDANIGVGTFSRLFVECLINGTALDADGSREEKERKLYEYEKREEIARLACEDARAERAAAKAAKKKGA